jgi:hypothetical protein
VKRKWLKRAAFVGALLLILPITPMVVGAIALLAWLFG